MVPGLGLIRVRSHGRGGVGGRTGLTPRFLPHTHVVGCIIYCLIGCFPEETFLYYYLPDEVCREPRCTGNPIADFLMVFTFSGIGKLNIHHQLMW